MLKTKASVGDPVFATTWTGTRAKTETNQTNESPFLRLRREIRDKIYEELLVARLNPKDQMYHDQVVAAKRTQYGDFGRENALDYCEQQICLMPDGGKGYRFIIDAMGLLLANKQIHDEANTTLFSKNVFLIMIGGLRVYPFWRRERLDCYIKPHLFKQIKHLYIIITNTASMIHSTFFADSRRIEQNLQTVASCFRDGGNELQTLKIRYTSCFNGEIDAVRDTLEGELQEGFPERTAILKDRYGKFHNVSRAQAPLKLFKMHEILDPLRALEGVAARVHIRGDLPGPYMDELKSVLSVPESELGFLAKKRREVDEAQRCARREEDSEASIYAYAKSMVEMYEGTEHEEYYRGCLEAPDKAPSVIAHLMKSLDERDMEWYHRWYKSFPDAVMAPLGAVDLDA